MEAGEWAEKDEADNAATKVQQECPKGQARDAQDVSQQEESRSGVLRDSKQARSRKKPSGKGQQRVQAKTKEHPQKKKGRTPQAQKVTRRKSK
jgi:hypothetical protein